MSEYKNEREHDKHEHLKRNAAPGYNPLPNGPQRPMSFNELAAFIAMFFWMDDGSTPYQQFPTAADATHAPDPSHSQVDAIQAQLKATQGAPSPIPHDPVVNKLFDNWSSIMQNKGLLQSLHDTQIAISGFLSDLEASQLWDGCAGVSLAKVTQIANM